MREDTEPDMKAKEKKKRLPEFLYMALALLIAFPPGLAAMPNGQQVVNGQASFNTQGKTLTVTNSPNSIINWKGFSIGADEAVRFVQQSSASAVLNRVTGVDPSRILGILQSNGRVFLVNPNGIIFGQGARIDVNGLVASSLNISNQDFLAGKYNFTAGGIAGPVRNEGTISTPSGGKVYLIAPSVENSGIINTPQGEVVLAAGRRVQLVDSSDPDITVVVSAPEDAALNLGQIVAQAGKVGIFGSLVTQKGIVNADSASVGENGRIFLKASKSVFIDEGSVTSASGPAGGSITVQGPETKVSGAISAAGSDGRGGDIKVLGDGITLAGTANVDASGTGGGGSVLVGGDFQGNNPGVPNAQYVTVQAGAQIKADATANGDGGKVVLWSDDRTEFHGFISARGGEKGGDGGNVEVSGRQTLVYKGLTDVRAPQGRTGSLLLDPTDYTIAAVEGDITGAELGNQLALANVTIQTDSSGEQSGDINVNDAVTWGNSNTLTLSAHENILINNNITNNAGGSLVLRADSDSSGSGTVIFNYGFVTLTGGGSASILYNPADGYTAPVDYTSYFSGVTPTAYMLVRNVNQLQDIQINLAGTYALSCNIDASATSTWNNGEGFLPLGDDSLIPAQSFTGIFNGFGHTISNLFIYRPATQYVGMFGGCGAAVIENVGMVNVNITGGFQTGGLVAHTGGTISRCYTTGTVTGTDNTVGGLVGLSAGTTINSYSTAAVSGNTFVGGLIGANYGTSSSVVNCYSAGHVTGISSVGGLSGYNAGSIANSYWDTQTSGQSTSYGGTGRTTAQMMDQATFAGWDFTATWNINQGSSYPYLIWVESSGTSTASSTAGTSAVIAGNNVSSELVVNATTAAMNQMQAGGGPGQNYYQGPGANQEDQNQPGTGSEGREGELRKYDDKTVTIFCN
jgi:filamentous hemagglutinin family protein